MAAPVPYRFSGRRQRRICALHNSLVRPSVTDMLTFLIYLARRKRPFVWAPAVDLSDPYVAAALAPVTHS